MGSCRFSLDAHDDGGIGVKVEGDLDPVSARTLIRLVEAAIGGHGTSRHLEIDLRGLRACSNSGVRALASCAELGARVREGLQFRMGITPDLSEYGGDGAGTLGP
jgi:anti-anti-sigma regulatory factor